MLNYRLSLQKHSHIGYGTAGFRTKSCRLDRVCHRTGIAASLIAGKQGKAIGVMITASHNQIDDNGVKITNCYGKMLDHVYESIVEQFCNSQEDIESLVQRVGSAKGGLLIVGGDSRPSTQHLKYLLSCGAKAVGGKLVDIGLCTTPQLHYSVYLHNVQSFTPQHDYKEHYLLNIIEEYSKARSLLGSKREIKWAVDCANGAGAYPLAVLANHFPLLLYNNCDWKAINHLCGSQHIQKQKASPANLPIQKDCYYVSFDGDADRIVFFIPGTETVVLEGDRIACLFATLLTSLLTTIRARWPKFQNVRVGVVQTMYSNYRSTEYLKQLKGIGHSYAATGVKFIEKEAEKFDLGVYFEPNGHGSIVSSEKVHQLLLDTLMLCPDDRQVQLLEHILGLNNPTVGDATTNLFLVDLALQHFNWTLEDVLKFYEDALSKTTKVKVQDKSKAKTTEIEDRLVSPAGLQSRIDEIVKETGVLKAFARPSGTEDIMRLHVEAESRESLQTAVRLLTQAIESCPQLR